MRAVDVGCVVLVLIWLPGCASHPVPRAKLPPAAVAQRSVHGGWVSIEPRRVSAGTPPALRIEGELIAIDVATVHVLTADGFQSIPRASVARITVVGYAGRSGSISLWAVLGGVSTLSHGGFLILTAPMWVVAGIVATHAERRVGLERDVDLARRYARFPQGLPADLDPKTLGALPLRRGGR